MVTSENARKLKAIRSRAMGLREIARAIGWSASRYQYYEDSYTKEFIPPEVIDLVLPHLIGLGEPPITEAELDGLLRPRRPPLEPPPPRGGQMPWIKDRVRDLKAKGKTMAGLAEILGVDPARITEITKGERQVKISELIPMAAYLEMTLEELVVRLTMRRGADREEA